MFYFSFLVCRVLAPQFGSEMSLTFGSFCLLLVSFLATAARGNRSEGCLLSFSRCPASNEHNPIISNTSSRKTTACRSTESDKTNLLPSSTLIERELFFLFFLLYFPSLIKKTHVRTLFAGQLYETELRALYSNEHQTNVLFLLINLLYCKRLKVFQKCRNQTI